MGAAPAGPVAIASAQPVDGWHQAVLDLTIAEVHLALGDWADAALAGNGIGVTVR